MYVRTYVHIRLGWKYVDRNRKGFLLFIKLLYGTVYSYLHEMHLKNLAPFLGPLAVDCSY